VQYPGGKFRNARVIAGWVNPYLKNRIYLEPFAGALSVGCALDPVYNYKLMSDLDDNMMSLWRAVQNGWEPPKAVSREMYAAVKGNSADYPKELVAFVSHACSYAGGYWAGYASNKIGTNYAFTGYKSIAAKKLLLGGMKFLTCPYTAWANVRGMVIYCDPPYSASTQKYRVNQTKKNKFDSEAFWEQVKVWRDNNNIVLISEFQAPAWVGEPVHQFNLRRVMGTDKSGHYTENLYRVGPIPTNNLEAL